MSKKEKFALYLTPEKKALLERRYQEPHWLYRAGD